MIRKMLLMAAMLPLLGTMCMAQGEPDKTVPEGVWVREGCEISVALSGLDRPRYMVVDPNDGTLYVNGPHKGYIMTCKDNDGDGYYESVVPFKEGVQRIVGMQLHDGWLWYGQTDRVSKARDTNGDGIADETVEVLKYDNMERGSHWYRPVLIHNGRLYTHIGDPGNATEPEDQRRMKIFSYDLEGKDEKVFATGVRNNEWLTVRPGTDEIWGVDNGSDWFGKPLEDKAPDAGPAITNMNPPEEVNKYEEGKFYGHPYITGRRMPRIDYMDRPDIAQLAADTTPPEWCAEAHWAALTIMFYQGDMFPCKGDAFIAYHGSWNRQPRGGYCVTRLLFDDGKPYGELKYANFLTEGGDVVGRPVGVVEDRDGSLLISEDGRNKVYRLKWKGAAK